LMSLVRVSRSQKIGKPLQIISSFKATPLISKFTLPIFSVRSFVAPKGGKDSTKSHQVEPKRPAEVVAPIKKELVSFCDNILKERGDEPITFGKFKLGTGEDGVLSLSRVEGNQSIIITWQVREGEEEDAFPETEGEEGQEGEQAVHTENEEHAEDEHDHVHPVKFVDVTVEIGYLDKRGKSKGSLILQITARLEGDSRPELISVEAGEQIPAPNMPNEFIMKPSSPVPYEELPEDFQEKFENYIDELGINSSLFESIINHETNSDVRLLKSLKKLLSNE